MDVILRIENVCKSFGGVKALKDVSLEVNRGEIYGLIGPNGAGKTTLLNIIAGVHKPETGRVYLAGENVTGACPDTLSKKGISRTFQIPQSFPQLTVLENVLVAATFGGAGGAKDEPEKRARQWLEFVGFPLPVETAAANLNTAQLKRLDLARGLASRPQLLLLDEVAAGLTPTELVEFAKLAQRVRETGVAIVVVEHLMRLIMQVSDRVAFLQSGEKIAEGTPQHIANDARVTDAYLGDEPAP